MFSDVGLTVLREIPKEFLTGSYTAYGGVIRDGVGKIVAHLAMPAAQVAMPLAKIVLGGPVALGGSVVSTVSGLVANAQLVSLSKDVHQVLQVAMAGTALAGLGLATSMVGFVYLARRISKVHDKLDKLNVAVKKVQQIFESSQQARLLAAIDTYHLASTNEHPGQHEALLLDARRGFSELTHHYKAQLKDLRDLAEIEVAEGYFVIACLGNAICTSDLGMWEAAEKDLRRHHADWRALARHHCVNLLELKNPTRLLDGRYVNELPTAMLVDVLDFAKGDVQGIKWLDELRRPLGKVKFPKFGSVEKPRIEFAKALTAREKVLDSFSAHFEFLATNKISATAFSRALEEKSQPGHAVLNWVSQPTIA